VQFGHFGITFHLPELLAKLLHIVSVRARWNQLYLVAVVSQSHGYLSKLAILVQVRIFMQVGRLSDEEMGVKGHGRRRSS